MITILKMSQYTESLWKNGLGKTFQIAIYPENASMNKNDFHWRISTANIDQKNNFSHFSKCERQLIIWKGDGVLLNGSPLLINSPIKFSGEEEISCELINNTPASDLGIIYKKDLIDVKSEILSFTNPTSHHLTQGLHFLFLANGVGGFINGFTLEAGECLKLENEVSIFISPSPQSSLVFYHFSITHPSTL